MSQQNHATPVEVFDPRGVVRRDEVRLAKRRPSLEGARLTVLDNSKWNAGKLLRQLIARLQAEVDSVRYLTKESFSKVATTELIDEIVDSSDLVLTAIGD